MRYLDKKEIEGIQQFFKEMEYNKMYSGFGNVQKTESDEFSNKNISTKISVDSFLNEIKIYLVIPIKEVKFEKIQKENGEEKEIKKTVIHNKNKLIIRTTYKMAEDFKSVTSEGKAYIIPDYFNKEAIKNNDEKTLQMIFYQLFSSEISKHINKQTNGTYKLLGEEINTDEKE